MSIDKKGQSNWDLFTILIFAVGLVFIGLYINSMYHWQLFSGAPYILPLDYESGLIYLGIGLVLIIISFITFRSQSQ